MHCSNCGIELIPGKRFCHACGTPVSQRCASCGAPVDPNFKFCPDCGARVGSSAAATTTAEPGGATLPADVFGRLSKHIPETLAQKIRAGTGAMPGERKLVTVLFCDLVGSTAIAERLDPEEYHDLLEQYLELAFRVIYRLEGIVNQLAGDGMMALFGAPVAHEDAPERAVQAALAIRTALGELNQRLDATRGIQLRARIGIHTGPVVVGTVGNDLKMDYTAIGDTTNLASRLESLAEPGTILVSDATQRLVRGAFEMRELGPFEVKGKSEPVVAYEVIEARELATPMEMAVERGLTPLVGRSEELSQLHACYQRLAGNLAQLVAVVGQAGSGKSRLLYEFKQQLVGEDVTFFEARCSSLSQTVPYAPWANMLRQYFEIAPGEAAGCACDKVARKMQTLDKSVNEISPFLCRILSLPSEGPLELSADELKRQTFEAVAHLVGAASMQAPVVMFIEDLQWMDESSREMLDLAVAEIHHARVMMVVSHRPDFQPAWHTSAAFTQLNLRPLSEDETAAIIRSLAGGTPPAELEQRILVKAEGNPFVTEEITRSLIEEGYLVRNNGSIRLTRPAAEIRMPDTVQELIGARLDRLAPHAKRVVQAAAVFGRQFHGAQVAGLLMSEGINVAGQLAELERRGVIHRKTVLSRDEFRFGESLTQEVAYEALLHKERRLLHERVGLLLEASTAEGSPERAALLAHHFVRSDNRDKAIETLLRAAHEAERLPSYGAAVSFFQQAWELADLALESGQDRGERMQRWAVEAAIGLCHVAVLHTAGDPAVIERAAGRGREIATALGDAAGVAGLSVYQGMLMMSGAREKFAPGLALVEDGLAATQRAGLELQTLSIARGLAWSYLFDGRFELAQRTITWVVAELERLGHREQLSDLYFGACWVRQGVYYHSDEFDSTMDNAREMYDLAIKASNRTSQSGAAATMAHIHFLRGEYAEAKEWADRSLQLAQAIGSIPTIRTAASLALAARVALGESVAAAPYVEIIDRSQAPGSNLAINVRVSIEALLGVGDVTRAERAATLAYEGAGGHLREAMSVAALGEVMLRLGPAHWTEAQRWVDRAIALAESIGARSTLALALLSAGELAAARGERTGGRHRVQQALAIFHELGLGHYATRAEQLLATLSDDAERVAGAP